MPVFDLFTQTGSFLARLLGMARIVPEIRGIDFFF
jgi:hypothetical protein